MAQVTSQPIAPEHATAPRPRPSVEQASRLQVFLHAVAFVVGFGAVFTLLGSAAGLLGRSLNEFLPVIQRMGAVLLVIFAANTVNAFRWFSSPIAFVSGLVVIGAFRWLSSAIIRADLVTNPTTAALVGLSLYWLDFANMVIFVLIVIGALRWLSNAISSRADLAANPAAAALVSILDFFSTLLYTEKRVTEMHDVNRQWGYLSSALLGVSFSAGWVPCVGPILASIFFLASDSATAAQGALLLGIYSLGLGIPFLITGAMFSRATRALRRLNRHAGVVSIISSLFLFYVAYLLWTDRLASLTTRFIFLNEWIFALEESLVPASATGGDIISASLLAAAPLAFVAGLISFLSPCVLPLVPAYIGFLSGAAVGGSRS